MVEVTDPITALKPYLVNAVYYWCVDHKCTPYLVAYSGKGSSIPPQIIIPGSDDVSFNVDPFAVDDFVICGSYIGFTTQLDGAPLHINIPIGDVMGIYGNGVNVGFMFDRDIDTVTSHINTTTETKRPTLTIVR